MVQQTFCFCFAASSFEWCLTGWWTTQREGSQSPRRCQSGLHPSGPATPQSAQNRKRTERLASFCAVVVECVSQAGPFWRRCCADGVPMCSPGWQRAMIQPVLHSVLHRYPRRNQCVCRGISLTCQPVGILQKKGSYCVHRIPSSCASALPLLFPAVSQ